ncbi:MAG: hypothetical protein ACREX0_06955 [Noviherbaspirillum sp.]
MRADSALSHLYDGELCIVSMKDGTQRDVRWSRPAWCFFFSNSDPPAVCRFEDIEEWRPASIRH